ncbi:hypothetical protein PFISCL1PPCAC_10193, partial [Pristionchus fissidentatus]
EKKVSELLSPVVLSVPGLPKEMSEGSLGNPQSSQAADTHRKRVQMDNSGGPPAKKSLVTQAWWKLKAFVFGRNDEDEERVITLGEDEEVDEEEEEEEDEQEEVGEGSDEDEDDDVVPLSHPVGNVHRVPEIVNMGLSTEEEEQVIRREVREEEVLIVETPEKTTVFTRRTRVSPAGASTVDVITLDSPVQNGIEMPCSSRTISTMSFPPGVHCGLSPEVTTRVMEYVTEQSSRVVTSAHSPSQSSTTSADRERLRVGDEEEDRGDSPLPEDSASRQVTPRSSYGGVGLERLYTASKRDTWRRRDKKDKEIRMIGRSRIIGKNQPSLAKKAMQSINPDNPYDENAKQRYIEILESMELRAKTANHPSTSDHIQQIQPPFVFKTELNTRQKLSIEEHKRRLKEGKRMAFDSLDAVLPRVKKIEEEKEGEIEGNQTASCSKDETIVLDDSSVPHSPRSPNESMISSANLSFHKVDKLNDIQSKIQELSLISVSGKLQYDIYNRSKPDFYRTVDQLDEEGDLRQKYRLETEKQHALDTRARLELQGIFIPEPEKKVDEFPDLSDEAKELCDLAWNRGGDGEKMRGGDPPLTRKDLKTLSALNWLNDEVILAYLNLIVARSQANEQLPKTYTFNTFFYSNISSKGYTSVKRWTKKVDIFSYDILLVPVHLSVHWTMAVVDVKEKSIHFYDSLLGRHPEVLPNIMTYLQNESMDKRQCPLEDISSWDLVFRTDIPQQHNGSDCGVFSCKFADFASRRVPVTFNQSHMPYYRKRMVYQLCQNDLNAH